MKCLVDTLNDLRNPERVELYSNVDEHSLLSTVTIAYFNLGAEYEHNNNISDALEAYEKVAAYAKQCNSTEMQRFAREAKQGVEKKLSVLEGALSRRSVMRDEGSVSKAFNDATHIKSIALSRRKRVTKGLAEDKRKQAASQM